MAGFFDSIGYYVANPQAIVYAVSTALLYPVLFAEVIILVYVVVESGRFTVELWRRRGSRSIKGLTSIGDQVREKIEQGKPQDALLLLRSANPLSPHGRFFLGLEKPEDLERTMLLKRLDEFERQAARRLERTRVFVRVGPSLGLMGTLIPISPALVALASGDVQTLSDNLVIAFSTTVVGLLIGMLAYVMSAVRDRLYARDVSDVEYILEVVGL